MKYVLIALLIATSLQTEAKTVHYELNATKGKVNLSGKREVDFALMLNKSIPAPTLEFTEGDDAEILLSNQIPEQEVSVHWHGILLPPEMDGVPYVNTPPIRTGESFLFKFRIRQHGTYWYHSHTDVQEQKGVYGAIVIHPKVRQIKYDRDVVAVLSDWSDENPSDVLKNLKKDGDYYQYKKETMRSWWGAISHGGLGTYLGGEWTRMGGMDLSDVGYDAFLINGKKELPLSEANSGQTIRIRLINAAASSYFYVALGQNPLKIVSADGIDIEPVQAHEITISPAETYDLLFKVAEPKSYELRVTAQDGSGAASGWIGKGERVSAPVKARPDLYAPMNHSGHGGNMNMDMGSNMPMKMDHSAHGSMEGMSDSPPPKVIPNPHAGHNSMKADAGSSGPSAILKNLTVDNLRAMTKTEFRKKGKVHDVRLELDGDMSRYVWLINNKAIHEERNIEIHEGDVVKFAFVNNTMMHHPMHLHGHFFRVVNEQGVYSPMKHIVDVPPNGSRVIEFLADEPGEWMLHCHNLYHLKSGMARVVKYSSFTPKTEIAKWQHADPHLHDHWYGLGTAEAATNHAEIYYRLTQTWNQIEGRLETRNTARSLLSFSSPWEWEGDLFYRRWLGRYINLVAGGTRFEDKFLATAGISYLLPFLIQSQLLVSHDGKFRFDLAKRFQWTQTVFSKANLTWRPNQAGKIARDLEFEISLMYSPAWSWAAGLMLTEDTVGAGIEVRF